METKDYYTVWSWHNAPYIVRMASPLKEQGTWIVRVEPGYGFPYDKVNVSEHPEWEVEQKEIDGRCYFFIRDPEDIPWPEFDPVQFDFSGYGYGSWVNDINASSIKF